MTLSTPGRMIAYGGSYYGDDGAEEWQPQTESWGLIQVRGNAQSYHLPAGHSE